jgi:hypothetical protein
MPAKAGIHAFQGDNETVVIADPPPYPRHASECWHPRLFKKKASASFLKKRSKKLSLLRDVAQAGPTPTFSKSSLLLFFKKEALPFLSTTSSPAA